VVPIDDGVDGLVGDVQFRSTLQNEAQCPLDSRRRPQPARDVRHWTQSRALGMKPRGWAGHYASRSAARLRIAGNIWSSIAGATRQFATDPRRAATQGQGDRMRDETPQQRPS
jgi:hypothetical protein